MPRSWLGPAVIAVLAFGVLLAGLLAVVQLLPAGKPRPTPTPTPVVSPAGAPAATLPPDEESVDDAEAARRAAGTAVVLTIGENTRYWLARADGVTPEISQIVKASTLYYGVVYGATYQEDVYYATTDWDGTHTWSRQGGGRWHYTGAYGECERPIPAQLKTAWGLWGSTAPPGPTCAPTRA